MSRKQPCLPIKSVENKTNKIHVSRLPPEQKVAVNPSGIWISKPGRWRRDCKIFRVVGRALEQWVNADTSDHAGPELPCPCGEPGGHDGRVGRDRVLASGSRNGLRRGGRIRAAIALRLAADSAAKGLQGGSCGQYNPQRRVDTLLHTQEVTGSSPVAPTMQTKRLLSFHGRRHRSYKGGVSG